MTQHTLGRHLVHAGDNLELLRGLPDNSVDAVVTDPPYGLGRHPDAVAMLRDWLDTGYHEVTGAGFMGRAWDAFVPQPVLWREVARVLKPGGHLVAFFGTRTYDVGTLAIRLAGLEVRDALAWVYGSGFPKSQNLAIALDKQAGAMGHRGKAHHAYAIGDDFEGRTSWRPTATRRITSRSRTPRDSGTGGGRPSSRRLSRSPCVASRPWSPRSPGTS